MNLLEQTDRLHNQSHNTKMRTLQKGKSILLSTESANITFGLVPLYYISAAIVTLPGSACTSQSGNLQPYGRQSFVHKIVITRLRNWHTKTWNDFSSASSKSTLIVSSDIWKATTVSFSQISRIGRLDKEQARNRFSYCIATPASTKRYIHITNRIQEEQM